MTEQMKPTNGNQQQSQAIVKGPQARQATLKTLFEKAKGSIAQILPKHLTPERLLKIVLSATSRTPELLECTPESILGAVMTAGALGLEPNTPLGLGYLVPFKNRKNNKTEAQFIPGYRGLQRLAVQSGEVQWIQSRVVYERDDFDVDYGTEQSIRHKPYLLAGGAGAIVGVYAVAEMKNGSKVFEFMTLAEVNKIRERSKASDDGPWKTDEAEMMRKTAIRRLSKSLPLSEEKLARALEHQARAESGQGPDHSEVIDVIGESFDPETGEMLLATNGATTAATRTDAMKDRLAEKAAAPT